MQFYPSGFRIAGRYEVAGRPLVGGMGIVYLCFDHQEQRPVALKTFKPEYLPDRNARERFLEEGNTWVRLGKHPHIVRCYGVERIGDGREVYLVLELVAKERKELRDASLGSWLTPGKPLPVDQALLIALQVARGVRHATETIPGFVHRDLKPENVLLGADRLSNASINRVRVTDFGLVKGLRAGQVPQAQAETNWAGRPGQLTRAGLVLGTPHYMAPEQWDSADVDARADIYALGCILSEMLLGRRLIAERSLDACRQAHKGGAAREAAGLMKTHPMLRSLLQGCLDPLPAERYPDWPSLTAALAAACVQATGQPAPAVAAGEAVQRDERVAVGWSYSNIGGSFLDIGKAAEAIGFFQRAATVGQEEGELRLRGAGLANLGTAHAALGDARQAIRYHEQALTISKEIGDRQGVGDALGNLGNAHADLGDANQAIRYYERALIISREIGDRLGEGAVLNNLGNAYANFGDARQAIRHQELALIISKEIGDHRGEGTILDNLGLAYAALGDARQAIRFYEQALTIGREIGDRRAEGNALGNLGNAYAALGDARQAIRFYEQALTIGREIGDRRGEGNALNNLGLAYAVLRDARQAIEFYEQAMTINREIGDRGGEGSTLGNLGNAYADLGDARQAIGFYEQHLTISREIGDRRGEGSALVNLGLAYSDLGDDRLAIRLYEQSLIIQQEIGDLNGVAFTSFNLALLLAQQGQVQQAVAHAHTAADFWSRIGHAEYGRRAQQLVVQLERQRR